MLDNNNKKKSLGRGLGALLGDDDIDFADIERAVSIPTVANNNKEGVKQLDINSVHPSKYQPRTEFDAEALNSLAQSIRQQGILQPLLVRKHIDGGFELIAGERRLRAAKLAGLKQVPVIEKNFTDEEVLEVALVENLLRENLSAIEEAEGFQRLIDEFARTQETVSQIVGKSRSHVTNTLRLLSLPENVKNLIREGSLSAGHARPLIGLTNAEELAKQIISKDLSVRAVEDMINKLKNPKSKPAGKAKNHDLEQIEKDLAKSLGLRLKINADKKGGGKVVLQYGSVAELDIILDILEGRNKAIATMPQKSTIESEAIKANNEKFTMKVIG